MRFGVYVIIAGLIILFILIVASDLIEGETPDKAIKCYGGSSTRTNFLTGTKTITVQMTFSNTGKQPHTFYGGVSIYDEDYDALRYKGRTMTLGPGWEDTITETFTVDYSYDFKGIVCRVD